MANRKFQLHLNRKEWLAVRLMTGAAKIGENGDYAACEWNKFLLKLASQLVGENYFNWLEHRVAADLRISFTEDELNAMRETAKYFK